MTVGTSVLAAAVLGCIAMAGVAAAAGPTLRVVPRPLPGHPGNVFLKGEAVAVPLPESAVRWRLTDYEGKVLATIAAGSRAAPLGKLDVGFYRLQRDGGDWVSLAVLTPLAVPTPMTSPICVDVAMAWFYDEARMAPVARLCALAGVNRVRDRLSWGEVEPRKGAWAERTKYDTSAEAQAREALQVLQVHHGSPAWANPNGKRFPLDLRDAYTFQLQMARRWKGSVDAFEPWNEADIEGFGGHTGAEMAALQKAAYLGLKKGNPKATACLNVFAVHQRSQLEDLVANEAWPYFDTYNLHHYEWLTGYPRLYADHRAVSAGRPMWVTECAMPVRWAGDPAVQEPSEQDLREQSERVPKVFAASLHEGSAATFYFILGHYVEGQTQFGLIRRDLTPRPGYLALAAAGRLLADARPLGRVELGQGVSAYAFRARPDGVSRVVVVAWANEAKAEAKPPIVPVAAYDHLGRPATPGAALSLGTAPQYIVLPATAASRLSPAPAPPRPRKLTGSPSAIVLQAAWPEETKLLPLSAHRIPGKGAARATLAVYNFGQTAATGTLAVSAPAGWRVTVPTAVRVEPMGRVELPIDVDAFGQATRIAERITIRGSFGAAGRPVVSFNVAPQGNALSGRSGAAVAGAADASKWRVMVSGGPMTVTAVEGGIEVEAHPTGGDRWVYPVLSLPGGVPAGVDALACDVELLEGDAQFRAIFDEAGGSSYVADLATPPVRGQRVQTVALLDGAVHGSGWSAPDANGQLDPGRVSSLKLGCNTASDVVRYRVTNMRWVRR